MVDTLQDATAAWEEQDTLNQRSEIKTLLDSVCPDGLQGKKVVFGQSAFVDDGTDVEVDLTTQAGESLTAIEAILFTLKGDVDDDTERLWADGVVTANEPASANTTSISRTVTGPATLTLDLAFWYLIIGT